MKILVDCDGPMFMSHEWFVKVHKQKTPRIEHQLLSVDDIKKWDTITDVIGKDRFFDEEYNEDFIKYVPVVPGSVEAVKRLIGLGHDITFVSSVGKPELKTIRKKRLAGLFRKRNIDTDFDTDRWEIRSRFLIDDKMENIKKYVETQGNAIGLVWARPWNIDYRATNKNGWIRWVWSWDDVFEYIAGGHY